MVALKKLDCVLALRASKQEAESCFLFVRDNKKQSKRMR